MGVHHSEAGHILEVDSLTVEFNVGGNWQRVVDDVSLVVGRSEIVGIVGESGSGKTVTAMGIDGLIPYRGGRIASGRVVFDGMDLANLSQTEFQTIRGSLIGMVFQQAVGSLNPALRIGEQVAEVARRHLDMGRREAWDLAIAMLDRVGIKDAATRAKNYPYQLSGGMCQRAMIAAALICGPKLLIADEPTTGIDVRVQRQILDLLDEIHRERQFAVLLVTHDLAIVAETCDRVIVMYAGQVVEEGRTAAVFRSPQHPYTSGLLNSMPRGPERELASIPGSVPSPSDWPTGCRFRNRCSHFVHGICEEAQPLLVHPDGAVRCKRFQEIRLAGVLDE